MKNTLLVLFFTFIYFISFGQKDYTVIGQAFDNEKSPLIAATVVALDNADSTMAGFCITDDKGNFKIAGIPQGKYRIQITYIGYGTFENPLTIGGDEKLINMGEITLYSGLNQLDEIVVKDEFIPLVIKKDTVEYNADAFRVRPNANVEELLKKLPGIEVDSDGAITAQGEEVNSVTVDGKKFFGDDPKMATKNIPADAVKKIQVFDKKSEKAEFSGVNDGNETKTINLELKEDKKIGLFGNVEGGYGTEGRYKAKVSINKFGSKYQAAGIVSYNNINDNGFSFNEYATLLGSSFRFGRGGRSNFNGPVNFGGLSNGNTTSLSGGLNLSVTPSKKFEMTTSYFITYLDKEEISSSTKEYTLTRNNFFENLNDNSNNDDLGHNVSVDIDITPDSIQKIDLNLGFKSNNALVNTLSALSNLDAQNQANFENDQTYDAEGQNNDLNASVSYNRRLGKVGRILTLEGTYGSVGTEDSVYLNQENTDVQQALVDQIIQDQIGRQDDQSFSVKINYKEPLGKSNYLDFYLQRRNFNSERIKDFFDYDSENQTFRTLNQTLSTLTNNDLIYNRAGIEYTIDKENYNIQFKGEYNLSEISGGNITQSGINNKYNYFLPGLSFRINKPNIRISYRTSVSEPSINQLQTIVDNSNPTELYQGNPNLRPEYSHAISTRYYFFDRFNLNYLWANLSYTYTKDAIVNRQSFDQNFNRITSPVNVANRQRYRGSVSYTTPIRPIKIKASLRTGSNLTRSINIINDQEQNVNTLEPYVRLSLENTNNDVVSLSLSGEYNYKQNRYSINTQANNDFGTQIYNASFLLTLPRSWYIDADYKLQIYSEEQFGDENTLQLFNASISKGFMNDRLTLKLSAFDILNQNQGLSRTITDTYIQESISNSIQQYFMLSFVYKLSEFSGDNMNMRFHRR